MRDDFIFFVFSLFLDATSAGIRQEMKIWPSLVLLKNEKKKRETFHNRSSSQNLNRERRYAAIFCNFFCVVSAHAVEKYISNGTISSIGTRSIRKRGYERTIFVVFARNFFLTLTREEAECASEMSGYWANAKTCVEV